ncbi:hypothetical protein H1R20_g16105, partial [Candolleomyces eurysporus]
MASSEPKPPPPKQQQQKSLLNSSVTSLSFLVALQLFSRLFTSVLNQALVRLASPSAFGTASIQFELVLSTILFLSREGVRNAILRSKTTGKEDGEGDERVKQLNLTFIPALLGVPLAVGTTLVYLAFASEEVRRQPHLTVAVALYAGAAVVELLSEPMHNRAMLELKTNVRVRAEGLGITAKSFVTFLVLFVDARRGQDTLALVAFALGQLAYSVVVFGHYARTFGVPWVKKPKAAQSGYFDSALLNLSVTMTFQSVIKHVLTEGDKLLLTFFSPLEDQGGYAIAANYGSLLARIVFQPLEETLRVFFSRLLTSQKKQDYQQAADALTALLSVQITISVLFVIFGSAYLVLGAWVYYIPVLALNGGLEAFLSSAASTKDLNRQSRWMFAFSVIYISAAVMLYRLGFGDVSLIYANTVNLAARILYCLSFASRFFVAKERSVNFGVWQLVPPIPFLVASAAASLLIKLSASWLGVEATLKSVGKYAVFQKNVLLHVGVGGSLGVSCLAIWLFLSRRRIAALVRRSKKD